MTLSPGTRVGSYEIVGAIGAGGMGEVYRARDTRLGRDVALKVLPDPFAGDADRLARFQREAQLLASLNHPNIGAIHGLEEAGGLKALVLELIEGETLADRIARGPMLAAEAVGIARQIVGALEAAHERGVIHRDLKPANVKVTPDGTVKVLDFGLAKAMENAPAASHLSHSPTLSLAGTLAGVILGTAAYMSPEQAKGLPADHRSDIFSFGCVLYEMLTGRQAFQAETTSETLAAILMSAPDVAALPVAINPHLRDVVARCLEKDPKRRWQAIGDVRYELEALAADPKGNAAPAAAASMAGPAVRPLWRRLAPIVATAVIVAAATSVLWNLRQPPAASVVKFPIVLPEDQQATRTIDSHLAISPDGSRLVYVANRQLYLRALSDMEARPIAGTNVDTSD